MLVERASSPPPIPPGTRDRAVVVLHPALAARYTRLVAAVSPAVDAALGRAVVANRVAAARVDPPELVLRPWRLERLAFARRLSALAARTSCLVLADVRDFYPSVTPRTVGRSLLGLGVPPASAGEIRRFLGRLAGLGVRGLPVGPDPSAVLANAVLSGLDRSLSGSGLEHLRWVDDVAIACSDRDDAARVLELVRAALAEVGLEPNERKTRIVVDPSGVAGVPDLSCARGSAARSGGSVG